MDASRGYHQIIILPEDEEKTTFITEYSLYCWRRMVNTIFEPQIGRNMEIYVDDMLVKSKIRSEHFQNLRETFTRLRDSKLKLNAEKCSFRVTSGNFMGYMIMFLEMKPPNSYKDI
ncbi:hypothetical protein LIER_40934 [Lithospermum erythrorhizon]|uniref:Reverse transcriptase domain-containing protein n=1 Tax=Lithospermum erythrorhizon TaxID=34254 RepID=A0AAV3R4Z8_LITER